MHASYVHQTNKYSGASLDHELKESTEQKFSPWRVYGISCEDKQAGRRKVDNAIIWWNWNSRFPSAIYVIAKWMDGIQFRYNLSNSIFEDFIRGGWKELNSICTFL